jgi:hypothetical protein
MKRPTPDPRALIALSYGQLARRYPHYARTLRWLHACRVLRRGDLERITWPHPTRRQTRQHGLTRLIETGLVEAIDEQRAALQLGRRGATLLARAGMDAQYRRAPGERVLPGLLIAGSFASALATQLMAHPSARALHWRADPFAGSTLRPDGCGTIVWSSIPQTLGMLHPDILQSEWTPRLNDQTVQLMLEIDSGAERAGALRARIRAWTTALQAPAATGLSDPQTLVVLWVTTGTWRWVETLRAAWAGATAQPAYFTTLYALCGELETAPLDLLRASWRDHGGRIVKGQQLFTALRWQPERRPS